jgi:hypothetical protein
MPAPVSCGKCGSAFPLEHAGPCPVCEDSPFGKPNYEVVSMDPALLLRELLAAVHRDGGHYTYRHGIEQSVVDAMVTVAALHSVLHEARSTLDDDRRDAMREAEQLERLGRACRAVPLPEDLS